jgi:hypothetical protein
MGKVEIVSHEAPPKPREIASYRIGEKLFFLSGLQVQKAQMHTGVALANFGIRKQAYCGVSSAVKS